MGLVGTVVDAAIGWLVQSILGSLFTAPMEFWTREVGLAEDVHKLKSEMRNVEMVLAAAEGRKIENTRLAQSLDDLKELLYDAEDVMDELDYYRLQQQIEQGKGYGADGGNNPKASYLPVSAPSSTYQVVCSAWGQITSWALRDKKRKREEEEPTHSTMLPLEIKIDISKRINGLVNNLHEVGSSVQRFLQLDISRLVLMPNQSRCVAGNTRLTTSVPIEPKVYGRDAERDKIIELLIKGGSSDLHVLPIVGIGGIGKTTLAKFVYCDKRIKDHFDLQMWVCVSTNFDEVRLTVEILEHVCKDRREYENISSFNVLQEILLKNIENKRFLLIFDDIWEDKDKSGWDKLLAPLKCSQVTGCMVLATTRRKSVAEMIGTMDMVNLRGLDEKEFWLFFRACAFGNENYECQPSLQSIGQQIAKALKGCPLAARSVGALLKRDVSYEHWRTVQDKWRSLQEKDDILPILKLSYDYLPFYLQRCFSYCSLFPEDHQFGGETLVQAWISQNFVQCEDTGKGLEETGLQYLDSLVDFGFFQKADSHYAMHDLMHELALQVSSDECATLDGLQSKTIRPCIRHLSIIITSHEKNEDNNFSSEKYKEIIQKIGPLQKLRTLMFFGHISTNLLKSLYTLCKEAKCLRLLRIYVSTADISSIHNFLKPYHLRYLQFICVSMDTSEYAFYNNADFSWDLTGFYHLQVLNIISGNRVAPAGMNRVAPAGMSNLVNLRHLIAHDKVHSAIACVGKMASLQELQFKVQNVVNFEIRQLQSMNELVKLGISQLENVNTKEEATEARLIQKEHLKELSLSWDDSSQSLEPERAKDVLEGLQPHQNLKTLHISRYIGATSPTWLAGNFSVTSLQILHLEKCKEWRILGYLEMLPLLRKLKLMQMWNLVEVSIPSLEELVFIDMPKLKACFGTYSMELTSRLRVLMIKDCPELNDFTPFQSYSSFEAEQKSWFPSLSKLTIWRTPHIGNWETLPLKEMGALKELELIELHAVRELSVPCLQKLVLDRMPSLASCSGVTASPTSHVSASQGDENDEWLSFLRELTIHDCPCLVVSQSFPPSASISYLSIQGHSTLPTMKKQYMRNFTIKSNELTVLDDNIVAFHHLRGITSLEITDCPNLISFSTEGLRELTILQYLSIRNCPNLSKSHGTSEAFLEKSTSAGNGVLPSLKYLEITACGIGGRWLTEMLLHVQSLENLRLHNCPRIKLLLISQPAETEGTTSLASAAQDVHLLKIPSNILCSLKLLDIFDCPDLEFGGGEGALGGFRSLENLWINGCPKLAPLLVTETKDDGMVDVGLLPPSLRDVMITHLPENLQSFFPKGLVCLKELNLINSPYLKSVQLHSCTALEELHIYGCNQLGVLEGLQFLSSLRGLSIDMNQKLSDAWDLKLQEQEQGGNHIGLLPPSLDRLYLSSLTDKVQPHLLSCLPTISKLTIAQSPQLTSLQLGYSTALQELRIVNCMSLASIEGFESVINLRSLAAPACPSLTPCLEFLSQQRRASEIFSQLGTFEISDSFILTMSLCKQLTSLRRLIFRESMMVGLTEEQESAFQLLTFLQEFRILGCPNLTSLPANLCSLAYLEMLTIWDSPSISRLPEMGLPPYLKVLDIKNCSEELQMECKMAPTKKLIVRIDDKNVY